MKGTLIISLMLLGIIAVHHLARPAEAMPAAPITELIPPPSMPQNFPPSQPEGKE